MANHEGIMLVIKEFSSDYVANVKKVRKTFVLTARKDIIYFCSRSGWVVNALDIQ
jgi:hypothetical protein